MAAVWGWVVDADDPEAMRAGIVAAAARLQADFADPTEDDAPTRGLLRCRRLLLTLGEPGST